MNIFKTFKLTWWQASIFKISVISLGIAIGAYGADFFTEYIADFLGISIIAGIYILYIWWKQK